MNKKKTESEDRQKWSGRKLKMYQYKVSIVKVVDGDTVDVDIDLGFSTVLKETKSSNDGH